MPVLTRRRPHWIVVGCCLLAIGASTAFAVGGEPSAKALSAEAKSTASAKPTAKATSTQHTLSFGLAYGDTLLGASDRTIDTALDDAVTLGAHWIRVDLPWESVQPESWDGYDWGQFDEIADAAQDRGLKIDAILDDVPSWARESSCRTNYACPPAEFSQFAAFAAAAATHYAPLGVNTWEVWNEPNIDAWAPGPDPAAYEQLLVDTSKALRAAEPDAFVILGGLAAVIDDPKLERMDAFDFLTQVAALGGTKYVNAVGFHPYSLPVLPSQSVNFQMISSSPQNLVSVLQRYGTPNVSIWLTETGAQVTGAGPDGNVTEPAIKTREQQQAAYATNLVQTVAANSYVGADFWYSDQDDAANNLYFGLRRANGTYRPAFDALKDEISACGCDNGH
jgi:hypothetical protein